MPYHDRMYQQLSDMQALCLHVHGFVCKELQTLVMEFEGTKIF